MFVRNCVQVLFQTVLVWGAVLAAAPPPTAAARQVETPAPSSLAIDALTTQPPVDASIGASTHLPPSLRAGDPTAQADAQTVPPPADIQDQVQAYRAAYDSQTPFKGFYFEALGAKQLDADDTGVDYRLEWRLLKDGWHEMRKDFDKDKNRNELQTLQLLNDLSLHWLNEQLDRSARLSQAVHYHHAVERAALLTGILEKRKAQLQQGYITRDDFDHARLKLHEALRKKSLYAKAADAALPAAIYDLLNTGESLTLRALEQVRKLAVARAYPVKIQQNLAERADFAKSWTDDVAVDLYLQHKDWLDSQPQDIVGFQVEIPLHGYARRRDLIEREKKLYQRQALVAARRIETNVSKLYDYFHFQQLRISLLQHDLARTAQRIAYEKERARRTLKDLDHTPERTLDVLLAEQIDLRYEAAQARLGLYEILLKLMALTQNPHPCRLLSSQQPDCPDR